VGISRSVLIVDDDPAISAPLAMYFRGLGHSVDVAAEAEEAGALLVFRLYDAAILDLRLTNLGGAEGLELLQEIRERNALTTVVVLSAFISAEARVEAVKRGAIAVLQKPHPLPDLARRVLAGSEPVCLTS
jgi:DNA-binding response OmpR family regulator